MGSEEDEKNRQLAQLKTDEAAQAASTLAVEQARQAEETRVTQVAEADREQHAQQESQEEILKATDNTRMSENTEIDLTARMEGKVEQRTKWIKPE